MRVKAYLYKNGQQKEIRRFKVVPGFGEKKSLYELLLKEIQDGFKIGLQSLDLCYKDDDGDLVALSSQKDMEEALQFLKDDTLYIHVKQVVYHPGW